MDTATIQRIKDFVKQRRQRSLTYDEKLDILMLQATLRESNCVDVAGLVARMLGRSTNVVKRVLAEFLAKGDVTVAPLPANSTTHRSRVPNTHAVRCLVRTFIRDRCVTRQRTVGKDVLGMLMDANIVLVDERSSKDYAACLRAVQAFLAKHGYARGKSPKGTTYRMSEVHEQARDAYVEFMVPTVSASPRRPIVYLDESFVHHHYSRHQDSLYDPTDTVVTKPKHKGRRYCFIAGILEDGSAVSHLLGLDIFVGGKKNGKTVKDYHGMFNHKYFTTWFEKLMDEVEELGWSSAVFVMDNAKYHKGKAPSTPKGTWKKAEIYEACVRFNLLDVPPTAMKKTMWARLKKYVDEHIPPVVVEMARSRGHHVVYTPPGFSELQPIELVWANVKGTVGRAYTSNTTFDEVHDRLAHAFWMLDTGTICDTIANSTTKLIELDRALRNAEGAPSLSDDESDVSSSSDSGNSTQDDSDGTSDL
ncbi:hypothetical protein DYB28_016012 [Aphanomyces astaci]|uniref:Tc1-like transposase DDE domain-containing protein n=2 Tax=Aphanomyces astaci TaxID=112090 RepID=A0A397BYQ9_APHAT|nr:hypothetical protein AaE_013466 [Aphanomyces astaci]RHY27165.1 hypothetical protein DYB25_007002 [Aphanomyces astaci]RHY40812.1 hypothetical protein DYB34_012629 [Aphanomyces astaci]RHZ12823.1 hypothetical protein DYB26_014494 [Aphanomyces astaci]RHZ41584.1 hypothetical protein DYB31_011551 [Aphanomyces astaci]